MKQNIIIDTIIIRPISSIETAIVCQDNLYNCGLISFPACKKECTYMIISGKRKCFDDFIDNNLTSKQSHQMVPRKSSSCEILDIPH